MFRSLRDTIFPKVPLVPIEVDSQGWSLFFDGARRHKVLKQTEGECVFLATYSCSHPFTSQGRESAAFPMIHWHRVQDEYIKVLSGRAGYVIDGKEGYANAGEEFVFRQGTRHAFWIDPIVGEDTTMEFTARPGSGIDVVWLNNVYGIMDSLYRKGKTLDFLRASVLALDSDSIPGNLPRWLGIVMTFIFGHIGIWAGYSANHPIYSNP